MSKENNYKIIEESKNRSEKIVKTLLTKEIEKVKKENEKRTNEN